MGYRVQERMEESGLFETVKQAGEKNGILFQEYPKGKVKDIMERNELAGFVEFAEDSYVIYKSADYEVEGITLEYFMNKAMNEGMNASLQIQKQDQDVIVLPTEELEFMPAVNARDYYGIVYIVYFCWCGMICATGVLSNEKKYGIGRRFQVSNLSGMAISTGITVLLYDIHWGYPILSASIVFLMIVAGSAMGMMFYNISDNLAITIILLFTIVWFLGFFGGSFETYMFSSMPDLIKQLSPIYHGNRALVELSCMGRSDYVVSAVLYSISITVICSGIAVLAGSIRKRGRA